LVEDRAVPFGKQTRLVVEQVDANCWKVMEDLVYEGNQGRFTVRAGFETDFATVPFFLTWLVPRYGVYTTAAVLHDWLLEEEPAVSRVESDGIFRRALRELGVPFLRRWVMWAAVRLGGWREQAGFSGVREAIAFVLILVGGVAFALGPGLLVLTFLALFTAMEIVAWVLLRLAPFRNRQKALNDPSFPWPRKGDCAGRPREPLPVGSTPPGVAGPRAGGPVAR
jgi:hypothetical protein